MSTTVSQFGSIAENVPSSLTGAVDWNNLTLPFANDGQYTTASFSSGNTGSNFLYLHGFNMDIPAGATIEGIEALVKRYAVGNVQDYAVYLAYLNNGQVVLTPINHAAPGNWLGVNQIVTYGSLTDLWGIPWVYYMLNDSTIGVVLSCQGDGSLNNEALIDSVQLSVTYHQNIFETGSGGAWLNGRVATPTTETTTGRGLKASGRATFTYNYTKNFDIFGTFPYTAVNAGGDAFVEAGAPVSGGAVLNGAAVVTYNISVDERVNNFDFYCTGQESVPPDTTHSNIAVAHVQVDPLTRILSWVILHGLTPADTVRFRGPADKFSTAPVTISVDGLESTVSPIIGSASVTDLQIADILNGLWYLEITQTFSSTTLRGQVANEATEIGGSSTLYGKSSLSATAVGLLANGTATAKAIYTAAPVPGLLAGGSAPSYVEEFIDPVGVLANSTVPYAFIAGPATSGGTRAAGAAIVAVRYAVTPVPGFLAGGEAVIAINQGIAPAGLLAAGNAVRLVQFVPPISGGLMASGFIVLQQTYSAPPIQGGLRIFGSWVGEYLKFYQTSVHRGYGRAMAGTNILKVTPTKDKLLTPKDGAVAPVLKTNRYALGGQPGWCEFSDGSCGSAYLPAIIKNRQNGFVPPKAGATVVEDDQIATASLNSR